MAWHVPLLREPVDWRDDVLDQDLDLNDDVVSLDAISVGASDFLHRGTSLDLLGTPTLYFNPRFRYWWF